MNDTCKFLLNCTTEEFVEWLNRYIIGDEIIDLNNINFSDIFIQIPLIIDGDEISAVMHYIINNKLGILDNINNLISNIRLFINDMIDNENIEILYNEEIYVLHFINYNHFYKYATDEMKESFKNFSDNLTVSGKA